MVKVKQSVMQRGKGGEKMDISNRDEAMMHDEENIRDTRPSDKRYVAYMCSLNASSEVWIGRCVQRWYGTFTKTRLCNKVMPYLEVNYIAKDWSYPFLITSYMLDKRTTVSFPLSPDGKTVVGKPRFARRNRKNEIKEKRVALVLSPTEYKLLPS